MLNVPPYCLLVQPDRGREVSHAPYVAVAVHTPDEPKPPLEGDAGMGLHTLDGDGNRNARGYLDLQVNMVPVGVDGEEVERGILPLERMHAAQEFRTYILLKIPPAVLGTPNNVVHVPIGRVVEASCSHESSLPCPTDMARTDTFIPALGRLTPPPSCGVSCGIKNQRKLVFLMEELDATGLEQKNVSLQLMC